MASQEALTTPQPEVLEERHNWRKLERTLSAVVEVLHATM
jgi:hypothetical protein